VVVRSPAALCEGLQRPGKQLCSSGAATVSARNASTYEGLALSVTVSDFANKACSRALIDQTTSHVMQ
jgi:hypothetical protein